jgi:hypothetical protein
MKRSTSKLEDAIYRLGKKLPIGAAHQCLHRVKPGNTLSEQMSSAVHPITDIAQHRRQSVLPY